MEHNGVKICNECIRFEWRNNSEYCTHYGDYLNNCNPCKNAIETDESINEKYGRDKMVTQK